MDTASAGQPRRRLHPIVKIDYVVRIVGCPLGALVVASARMNEGQGYLMWAVLLVYAKRGFAPDARKSQA